jgi:hypothetical protein
MNPFKNNNKRGNNSNSKVNNRPFVVNMAKDFPSLNSSISVNKEIETNSFLSAVSKPVEVIKVDKNALDVGWVSLSYDHNKLVKRANLTVKPTNNKTNVLQSNAAIENIEHRRQQTVDYYNGLYGAGEYEEKFAYREENDDELYSD